MGNRVPADKELTARYGLEPTVEERYGKTRQRMGARGEGGDREVLLFSDPMGMGGDGDEVVYEERGRFMPLVSAERRVDPMEADLAVRVQRTLAALTERQRELLVGYFIEGLSWRDLRQGEETRQSVHESIAWARKAFEREWLAHGEDPVVLTEDDF